MLKPSQVNCRACPLFETRRNIVDGAGSPEASLMIIGEAPGEQEDYEGMPFRGRSGKLLRAVLAENGFPDGSYYLTNTVKCRPPDNRNPTSQEITACSGWLIEELANVQPRRILALGKIAQTALQDLQDDLGLTLPAPVEPFYHPAYILRAPRARKPWAEGFLQVGRDLGVLPGTSGDVRQEPLQPGVAVLSGADQPDPQSYAVEDPDPLSPYFSADIETDDLEESRGYRMVGYSVSDGKAGQFYPVHGEDRPLASRGQQGLVTYCHNVKYDGPALGIDLRDTGSWECTMLMAYVLRYPRVGLKLLAPELAGMHLTPITGIIGTGKKRVSFSTALANDPEGARRYGTEDAVATARIARVLDSRLQAEPRLEAYYRDVEKPAVAIIRDMEDRGALVDPDRLQALGQALGERITANEQELSRAFNHVLPPRFKRGSTRQFAQALLNDGVTLKHKTPTGLWKLDDVVMEILEQTSAHPAIKLERQIRKDLKLKSTYTDALLAQMDPDHRIHARFNQAVTNTSRLSSSDPNLQNIPVKTPDGKKIREAFIARPGHVFVKADASQLEVRFYAEITGEPVLLDAYTHTDHDTRAKGGACLRCDVHQQVADSLGISRSDAKNTLFAAIYGAEPAKLAITAGVPQAEAGAFLTRMRQNLPTLLTYRHDVAAYLLKHGYVETLLGFRGYFPAYASIFPNEKSEALRQAGNHPIQGSGAGVIKVAMTEADEIARKYEAHLVLTVHDEVDYEVPAGNVRAFAWELRRLFEAVARRWMHRVPFRLDVAAGTSWGTVEELPDVA